MTQRPSEASVQGDFAASLPLDGARIALSRDGDRYLVDMPRPAWWNGPAPGGRIQRPVELAHREPYRFGVDRHLKRFAKRIDHLRDRRMSVTETPNCCRRAVQAMRLVRLNVVDDCFVLDLLDDQGSVSGLRVHDDLSLRRAMVRHGATDTLRTLVFQRENPRFSALCPKEKL